MRVLLLQTSDASAYVGMLAVTARANRLFALQRHRSYEAFIGLKRGFHPWQATFNRILMLDDAMREDRFDWVIYLDADAYVLDVDFDIEGYLETREATALIVAGGAGGGKWDVNAGVFFLNLRHPAGRRLVETWKRMFLESVTEPMLRDGEQPWSLRPDDQELLQTILQIDPALLDATEIASHNFINSPYASFIRQVLRAHQPTMKMRIAVAQYEIMRQTTRTEAPSAQSPDRANLPRTPMQVLLDALRPQHFFMLLLGHRAVQALPAWLDRFPYMHCFVLTDEPPPVPLPERSSIWQVDVASAQALDDFGGRIPFPRLVIDEGTTSSRNQQLAFLKLFPALSPGGHYFVTSSTNEAGSPSDLADAIAGLSPGAAIELQVGTPAQQLGIAQSIARIHVDRSGPRLIVAVERAATCAEVGT